MTTFLVKPTIDSYNDRQLATAGEGETFPGLANAYMEQQAIRYRRTNGKAAEPTAAMVEQWSIQAHAFALEVLSNV